MNEERHPLSASPADPADAPAEPGTVTAESVNDRFAPSVPPPTDDIDADWGADETPRAAAQATSAIETAPTPAPEKNPLPLEERAAPRRSSWRNQTLLGISPHSPTHATSHLRELEGARDSSRPPRPASQPPRPASQAPRPLGPGESAARQHRQDNPLRKRTLIGILPPTGSEPSHELPAKEHQASAPRGLQRVPTEAPTTNDLQSQVMDAISSAHSPSSAPREFDVASEAPPTASSRRWLLGSALAVALALALIAIAALGDRSAPPAPTPALASVGNPARNPSATEPVGPAIEPAPGAAEPDDDSDRLPATVAKKVQVSSKPEGARIFWRGKDQGTTPVTIELPAGTRRTYEVEAPGYVTRKLVVDGSQSEIKVGLRALPAARPRTRSRD